MTTYTLTDAKQPAIVKRALATTRDAGQSRVVIGPFDAVILSWDATWRVTRLDTWAGDTLLASHLTIDQAVEIITTTARNA